MKIIKVVFSLCLTSYSLSGCVNLDHINSFSKTAVATVNTYNDIGYTFTSSYKDYFLTSNVYDFQGNVDKNVLLLPIKKTAEGEPQMAIKADKAIAFYITSISAYFDALNRLSKKDLVNYDFDKVAADLKSDAGLKTFLNNTTDGQIDAAASISKIFANEILGAYRANKIKSTIIKYDDQVATSIETLKNILAVTLAKNVLADTILVNTKYKLALLNSKIAMEAKIDISDRYRKETTKLENVALQLQAYEDALVKIEKEHHAAAEALKTNKLSAKEVITIFSTYSAEIYQLYQNIKSLNNKN